MYASEDQLDGSSLELKEDTVLPAYDEHSAECDV